MLGQTACEIKCCRAANICALKQAELVEERLIAHSLAVGGLKLAKRRHQRLWRKLPPELTEVALHRRISRLLLLVSPTEQPKKGLIAIRSGMVSLHPAQW